jgi:hypothetical protein
MRQTQLLVTLRVLLSGIGEFANTAIICFTCDRDASSPKIAREIYGGIILFVP